MFRLIAISGIAIMLASCVAVPDNQYGQPYYSDYGYAPEYVPLYESNVSLWGIGGWGGPYYRYPHGYGGGYWNNGGHGGGGGRGGGRGGRGGH